MINQSLFTTQPNDWALFNSTLTLANAQHFDAIYQALRDHAIQVDKTLLDYVAQGVCVALPDYPLDAIATLKGLNLIISNDNLHIGLTALGYDYHQHIQA